MLLVRGVIRGTVAVIRDIMEVVYGHGGDNWSKNNDNCIVKKERADCLSITEMCSRRQSEEMKGIEKYVCWCAMY